MKPLHQLLLGAGLLVPGPVAEGQHRADYAGTWLNTAAYTQSVSRLDVRDTEAWAPRLEAWEGLPASPARRGLGYLWSRPAPDGTVARQVARLHTADVAEMYVLDLRPDGSLWVLRHVSVAGTTVRCDTMRFERRQGRHAARPLPDSPEVVLHFTPAGPVPTAEPTLLALRRSP